MVAGCDGGARARRDASNRSVHLQIARSSPGAGAGVAQGAKTATSSLSTPTTRRVQPVSPVPSKEENAEIEITVQVLKRAEPDYKR